MTRSPSTPRLLLALAPLLGLAPACEKVDTAPGDTTNIAGSEGDSEADTDPASPPSTTTTTSATEGDDSEGADSEGDSETSTTTDPLPPDDECQFLVADMSPDEILAAWTTSQSWGGEDRLEWCEGEHSMPCTTAGGEEGTSLCVVSWGAEEWTTCAVEHACTPDDVFEEGECQGTHCAILEGALSVEQWYSEDPCCGTDDPCCWTPLVVSFDGEPIRFEAAGAAAFDISGQGSCLSTDWPAQPWLALDRDGDGLIGSGRELFGSGTLLTTGVRASHGFEALGEFDVDRDGKITAADPIFHELVLWSDHNSDRRGALGELMPVAEAELIAIDLGFGRRYDCDERGNCGVERSAFEFRDALGAVRSGQIVDVHLPCQ
ncbi:hypothetical protein [Nannocystis bainbridge]|uniref:Uncharacterized protein n=1 Tax=Nannocystis bainbridge TaxID=2995303 RepID=A0ABT5DS17_9BACT|nr:hypothetical protein [Nannocystis bainbridge]MDC0716440.1 hypothetical protein [Nannocystis bainbridge]